MTTTLTLFLLVSLLLISIGLAGLVTRRTLVGMLISVELMLNGAGLAIVAAAKCTPASEVHGQLAALFVMGLAAAEATLVLAMILVVQRRFGKVTLDEVSIIRSSPAKGPH
ncbi:MAG: NADH-quinone oxidoreductase subunit NuoK [Deltaproteobacteria bacterium]|jgi:NADH-quinone oxidoreductase subunit K|nr:NADH-quinone oxidoreductase subunit NuoK [Deltaproteobacteria bacterium]